MKWKLTKKCSPAIEVTENQLLSASKKILRDSQERAPLMWKFLVANQPLSYRCNNNKGLDKAYSRWLVVNQSVSSKLRNNVIVNKSWFTVINLTEENHKGRKKITNFNFYNFFRSGLCSSWYFRKVIKVFPCFILDR